VKTPIIAVVNQKGGVGKTATTLAIASAAARAGQRVLVLDMDPQGNASTALLGRETESAGILGVLAGEGLGGGHELSEVIESAGEAWPGVDLAASIEHLARVELDPDPEQPFRLRHALQDGPELLNDYDLVLVDCPPGLGRLLLAALYGATHVLIVTEPSAASLAAMGRVEATMTRVRKTFRTAEPLLLGVLINRRRQGLNEHDACVEETRAAYGDLVLAGEMPERIAVAAAYVAGVPIHSVSSRGAISVSTIADGMWQQIAERAGIGVLA
jgi:chromosome partitioning protein